MISVETVWLSPRSRCQTPSVRSGPAVGEGARSPEAARPERVPVEPSPWGSLGWHQARASRGPVLLTEPHVPAQRTEATGRPHPGSVVWWLRTQTPRTEL